MRPKALLQLGGVCLNPPENRRVIDSYPAILKHQLKVPVADGEHPIPPHRPQDDLARELPSLEPLTLNQHRHSGESLSNPYYALSSRCQKVCNRTVNHGRATKTRFFSSLLELDARFFDDDKEVANAVDLRSVATGSPSIYDWVLLAISRGTTPRTIQPPFLRR
jgi:hypothetical protein